MTPRQARRRYCRGRVVRNAFRKRSGNPYHEGKRYTVKFERVPEYAVNQQCLDRLHRKPS